MAKINKNKVFKIAVTGPESTGKSQLARELNLNFPGMLVPEYARTFLESHDKQYTYEDILLIARQQWKEMQLAGKKQEDGILFCDTEMTVLRIWCEYKYGKCHDWIIEKQEGQEFDLYLLMDIDLPWQPDPLREHPDNRKDLMDLYIKALEKQNWPYVIVSGFQQKRIENAVRIIKKRVSI